MTEDETAAALGVTPRTVRRDWLKARMWLYAELSDETDESGGAGDTGHDPDRSDP